MSEQTLFDPPAPLDEARARHEAARCIGAVRDGYLADVDRARLAGLTDVARLYDQIVRELDRAAQIALTDPDTAALNRTEQKP